MEGARYLEDGRLTVFKRDGSYYARIRLTTSARYLWRSLKTFNEQTAIDLGRRLLFQLEQRAEEGLPPKSKLFAAVIDHYIAYRERDHRHGKTSTGMLRQIIRVSKFWREYAGKLAVEVIDDKVMRGFIPWRRDYYENIKKLPKNAKPSMHLRLVCLPHQHRSFRASGRKVSWICGQCLKPLLAPRQRYWARLHLAEQREERGF
jgi:hypothetical protein